MATAIDSTTQSVLTQHVQALISRNLDSIVGDYAADGVVFTPNGAFKGHEQIRAFFEASLQMLTVDALNALKVSRQEIDGEFAYVLWSAGTVIPFAGDTFCVHDGKIVMQSFVPAPIA
jgi:ketosteroid isomerase-like protein